MITKKFVRNSLIYTIAGALPLASAILLLPFYLEYLSTAVYGRMALYMGFSLLVQIVVTNSFDSAIYNYFHEFKNDKAKLYSFVSSAFVFILIVGALTGTVLAVTGGWIFERVFTETKILFYPYGLIAVATGVGQSVFKMNSSLLQTQERASSFLWQNLLSFSLIAFFSIGGLYFFPDSLIGPIGGRFLATGITAAWVLVTVYRQFGLHFNFSLLKSTFGFTYPALIYQIMQWFNNYYDRILLSLYLPIIQVGIYDFAAKCLSTIEFVLVGFYNSFFPKVLGIIALQTEKKTTLEINRYYNGLTAVTILMVSLCIFCFPVIIDGLITKPGYREAVQWIPLIAVTYLLRSMRFYVAMPYAAIKYSKPLPVFYLIIVAIKVASMVVMIPVYGIKGVIMATWIGYVVEILILFFGIRGKFQFQFNAFKLIGAPVLMVLLIGFAEPWLGGEHPYLLHLFYGIAAFLILRWAYRNELRSIDIFKVFR